MRKGIFNIPISPMGLFVGCGFGLSLGPEYEALIFARKKDFTKRLDKVDGL